MKKEETSIGVMQILGALVAMEEVSRRDPERNILEYVEMKVGSVDVLTMVDSGATHNLLSEDIARRIGLKFVSVQAQMKTVNSPPNSVIGVNEKVNVTLGEWIGKVNFTVVKIDDYEARLGIEFMKEFVAMIVPHMRKLYIYDRREDVPIGVPTVRVTKAKHKLTVMSMKDGKKGEEIYKRLSIAETKLME